MSRSRRDVILELIRDHEVETQEQLVGLLVEEGFDVTQATVSRDIGRLGLNKISVGGGRQRYVLPERDNKYLEERYERIFASGFISMDQAGNILVIKTAPGMAGAVATALEAMHIPGVVGVIAGHDTIMAAIRSEEQMSAVMSRIRHIL